MRVIDNEHRTVLLREVDFLRQRRERAFHREHTVGHHHFVARVFRGFERTPQIAHVAILESLLPRFRQTHAVDDRRVIELVRDDRVLLEDDRLKQTLVRVPARAVQDRILGAEKFGDALLELTVNRLRAADEAHRGEPVSVVALRFLRGFNDRRVIGESEVVVGGEHDHLPFSLDFHHRALRRFQRQLALQRARFRHFLEF